MQWKKQERDGQKLSATLTHGRPAEDIKRNKIIEKNNKNAVHIDRILFDLNFREIFTRSGIKFIQYIE